MNVTSYHFKKMGDNNYATHVDYGSLSDGDDDDSDYMEEEGEDEDEEDLMCCITCGDEGPTTQCMECENCGYLFCKKCRNWDSSVTNYISNHDLKPQLKRGIDYSSWVCIYCLYSLRIGDCED